MRTSMFFSKKESFSTSSIIQLLILGMLLVQVTPLFIGTIKHFVENRFFPKTKAGVIKIEGVLTEAEGYVKQLETFAKDTSIDCILLNISSPGGAPGTSQVLYEQIARLKEKKPVIAYVENMCASGAYYLSSVCNKIVANPCAIVGSIGVAAALSPNIQKLLEEHDILCPVIKSGRYKMAGSPTKPLEEYEREYLQKLADDTYDQFLKDVAAARNLNLEEKDEWADGKIFNGRQALELGLIDMLGGIITLKDEIKKLVLKDLEVEFISPPGPSLMEKLTKAQGGWKCELRHLVKECLTLISQETAFSFRYLP